MTFDGFIRVYKEGRDEGPDEDAESTPAGAHRRAAPAHARGAARTALHPAAAAFLRGLAREDTRGARHRPPLDLRLDHRHDPAARVRTLEDKRFPRGHRRGRDRQADRALPRRGRREVHRVHGEEARRHRRGRPAQDARCSRSSTARSSAPSRRPSTRSSGSARSSTRRVRSARPRAREPGHARGQARPLRQVRGLHELPGMPLHPQHGRQRAARARDARRDVSRVRQAVAAARGPLRSVHRLQRLSRLPLHQEGPARCRPASPAPSAARAS